MKIVKCVVCGQIEVLEFAERDKWEIYDHVFIEEIHGYYGKCPKCKKAEKAKKKEKMKLSFEEELEISSVDRFYGTLEIKCKNKTAKAVAHILKLRFEEQEEWVKIWCTSSKTVIICFLEKDRPLSNDDIKEMKEKLEKIMK